MNFLIQAENLEKTFIKDKKQIPVLKQLYLSLGFGEKVAIVGASGAGKSTLLHVLGTLDLPSAGKVFFRVSPTSQPVSLFDLSASKLAHFRNQSLGFVFQFHYLLSEFSAVENVMMPALIAGFKKKEALDQATQLLDFMGLKDRLGHRPSELSGGEQQRVALARAVILRPQLILADELTGNLDAQNKQMVMNLLLKLNQTTKVGILLVTHDQDVASQMDRILVMKDGKILPSQGNLS